MSTALYISKTLRCLQYTSLFHNLNCWQFVSEIQVSGKHCWKPQKNKKRWSCWACTYHISKEEFRCVLPVIPVPVILPLSEKLYRWLGTILLLGRHVEVIHKHYRLLSHWRTKHTFTTSVQLRHDDVLCLIGWRSGREVDQVGNIPVKGQSNILETCYQLNLLVYRWELDFSAYIGNLNSLPMHCTIREKLYMFFRVI